MYNCPNCNEEIDVVEVCPRCGYDFNTILTCPYKMSGNCLFLHRECKLAGLNYEDCQVYLKNSGIV